MNFYQHHIGDYAAATMHLTFLEDAAYSRLIRIYYRDEKPLPADVAAVQRLAGARSKEEREAVEIILSEFFTLEDDGWHNKRCDEEIGRASDSREGSDERKANDKERKRRYRQRRAELFEQCRDAGLVPPFDASLSDLESLLSRGQGADGDADKTRTGTDEGRGQDADGDGDGTANQTPDSRLQKDQKQKSLVQRAARSANRFPEFWAAYPVKKGRSEALAKWTARGLDAIADRIIADVQARKAHDRQWLDGYAPHGSTYVNGRGWEDEIETGRKPDRPGDGGGSAGGVFGVAL